jgi:hypothetical protein
VNRSILASPLKRSECLQRPALSLQLTRRQSDLIRECIERRGGETSSTEDALEFATR